MLYPRMSFKNEIKVSSYIRIKPGAFTEERYFFTPICFPNKICSKVLNFNVFKVYTSLSVMDGKNRSSIKN